MNSHIAKEMFQHMIITDYNIEDVSLVDFKYLFSHKMFS